MNVYIILYIYLYVVLGYSYTLVLASPVFWDHVAYSLLICHSNLGSKTQSHQRLIIIRHENGVIVLQNE